MEEKSRTIGSLVKVTWERENSIVSCKPYIPYHELRTFAIDKIKEVKSGQIIPHLFLMNMFDIKEEDLE